MEGNPKLNDRAIRPVVAQKKRFFRRNDENFFFLTIKELIELSYKQTKKLLFEETGHRSLTIILLLGVRE